MEHRDFYRALTDLKGGKPEPLHETMAVLSYEVGRMMEQAMYMHWEGREPVRMGFFKSELMDAIAQLILISQAVGADWDEMINMGIEKAMERFTGQEHK